ncbi:hypothetical protein CIPAW_03G145900 [Carya illinoinensis]|uniref:Uncharacterized protein n=1 Tax=Carya illinoinensis TaxID=32201 RepID=A0A8T1R3D0_CARIL|nr:hypothetical protein CIPAW_03G145900 [Carya illinoinensis]
MGCFFCIHPYELLHLFLSPKYTRLDSETRIIAFHSSLFPLHPVYVTFSFSFRSLSLEIREREREGKTKKEAWTNRAVSRGERERDEWDPFPASSFSAFRTCGTHLKSPSPVHTPPLLLLSLSLSGHPCLTLSPHL